MKERSYIAFLGLGSNIGRREQLLADAVQQLGQHPSIEVTALSPIYETEPVGYTDQPSFLNQVCRIATALSPEDLLNTVLQIERSLGRERVIRWGPRTIDIDVLLYDNRMMHTETLTVPHPRMKERAFVFVPLLDVMEPGEREWQPGFEKLDVAVTGVRKWISSTWPDASARSGN